jgi:hypothetical protein
LGCERLRKDHPSIRVTEADIDKQVLAVFDKMRVGDAEVRDWFRLVLASQTRDAQADSRAQRNELQRQETLLVQQQDRLLNMRLAEDIDQETFGRKHTELRDQPEGEYLARTIHPIEIASGPRFGHGSQASEIVQFTARLLGEQVVGDALTK